MNFSHTLRQHMYCQTRVTCSNCMCAGLQVLLHLDELYSIGKS